MKAKYFTHCYVSENSIMSLQHVFQSTTRNDMLFILNNALETKQFDVINVYDTEGNCLINVKDGIL